MGAEHSLLHQAVRDKNKDLVLSLIRDGVDVNEIYPLDSSFFVLKGNTPLYLAVLYPEVEILKLLIENGADVNQPTEWGETPLIGALSKRDSQVVKLLIQNGADVNRSSFKKKPRVSPVRKILLKTGTLRPHWFQKETTPLFFASSNGYFELVKLLLEKGADINGTVQGELGDVTPLWVTAKKGHSQVVKLLIKHKADVNKSTPLYIAQREGHSDIVKLLKENGADIQAAVRIASTEGHFAGFQNLIEEAVGLNSEAQRKNEEKILRKFWDTFNFISEIPATMNQSIDEMNRSLEQLKEKFLGKLQEKEEEVEQLRKRIGEMEKNNGILSKDRDEIVREMGRLEGAKTQLNAQIQEMKRLHQEELDQELRKAKSELEARANWLLKESERRIEKLESRIDGLEGENRNLRVENEGLEQNFEQLAIEYKDYQDIGLSSGNAQNNVLAKQKVRAKGKAGFRKATKALRKELRRVEKFCFITINYNNQKIQSSGPVTGTLTGGVESIDANFKLKT